MFDKEVINEIKDKLCTKEHTLAVAESVTGGLMQTAFSNAEFASQFFQGGISVYNVGQKVKHLMIEPIHAIRCNCVSSKISVDMALHVCSMFHSDWGISVTGYAAPVPESGNKLFAYYAISFQGKIRKQGQLDTSIIDPLQVKYFYVNEILKQLKELL